MASSAEYRPPIRRYGVEALPAMLFVAGFGDDSSMFIPLADTELASRHSLVMVDLPGFGNAAPLRTGTTLEALADVVHDIVEKEQAQFVVAHSVASIIVSLAARRSSLIDTIISLEGNLTADDAYFSGTAADFDGADDFRRAFLARLDELAKDQPIIARYRSVVAKADPKAMWELGCDTRKFSAANVPGDVLIETAKICYLYNPTNCPKASLEWLQSHPIPKLRMDSATHWASVDQPRLVSKNILKAIAQFGERRT
jgi:pimeloyl-ACP methyl ester carboxylesterase